MSVGIILILPLIVLCCLPFLRGIFRSSRDPKTGFPHRRTASLALLFTLLGVSSLFPLFSGSFGVVQFHLGGHTVVFHESTRMDALQAEIKMLQTQFEETLRNAASPEQRSAAEQKLIRFGKEMDDLLMSSYQEDKEYTKKAEDSREEIRRQFASKRQNYEAVPVVFIAFVLLPISFLFVPGTILGWWYLIRIRPLPEKPNWIRAMLAALLVPCFLLWCISCSLGVQIGIILARDFELPVATMQLLGGLIASGFSLMLIAAGIRGAYRLVFPKPKTRDRSASVSGGPGTVLPLGFLLAALFLYGLGMVFFIPGKISLIPLERELGFAKAHLRIFQSLSDSNESELRYLRQLAGEEDPRRLVRSARKKVDDLLIAEQREIVEEKQNICEQARAKQVSWLSQAGRIATFTGIFSASLAFVFSLHSLILLRNRKEKRELIPCGLLAYLSPAVIVGGFFSLQHIRSARNDGFLVLVMILIATPVLVLLFRGAKDLASGRRDPVLGRFATLCTALSLSVLIMPLFAIFLETRGPTTPLPTRYLLLDRGLALEAEIESNKAAIRAQNPEILSPEWESELEKQRESVLAAIRSDDARYFGHEYNGEYGRIMHNTRADYGIQELSLRELPLVLVCAPLFSLGIPGTIFGLFYFWTTRKEKTQPGRKKALFAGIFWPCIIALGLIAYMVSYLYFDFPRLRVGTIAVVFAAVFSPPFVFLSLWGWRKLRRIRNLPQKQGWIFGMLAAWLFPGAVLLGGFTVAAAVLGVFPFRDTVLLHDAWFCGGLVGFLSGLSLLGLFVYGTYRWVFPVKPSPVRTAWWGLVLVAASVFPVLVCFVIDEHFLFSNYSDRLGGLRTQHAGITEEENAVAEIENNAQISRVQKRKHIEQIRLLYSLQRQGEQHKRQQLHEAMERYNRGVRVVFVGGSILISLALALSGTVLGWGYLNRLAGTSEHRGLIPALIAAMPLPLLVLWIAPSALLLIPIYALDLASSAQGITAAALLLGNLIGLLLVAGMLRWTFLRFSRNSNPQTTNVQTTNESEDAM